MLTIIDLIVVKGILPLGLRKKLLLERVAPVLLFFVINGNPCYPGFSKQFSNLSIKDGLPHNTINYITQDRTGYIWLGTDGGLVKYDGHTFRKYMESPDDPLSVGSNQIIRIYEDDNSTMWIGTKSSLDRYNADLDRFKSFFFYSQKGDIKLPVFDIAQLNDSVLLVATDGGGLYMFNKKNNQYSQFLFKGLNDYLKKTTRLSCLHIGHDGKIWLGTKDNGVFCLEVKSGKLEQVANFDFKKSEISAIQPYKTGKLLIATYGQGLWIYTPNEKALIRHSLQSDSEKDLGKWIFSLQHDKPSGKWYIGTDGNGLLECNEYLEVKKQYISDVLNPYSISSNTIKTIFIDKEENLWAGHFKRGVSFSQKTEVFNNILFNPALKNTLSHNIVSCIAEASEGEIWIGTDGGGLNILGSDDTIYNQNICDNSISSKLEKSILALYKDHEGTIWIGTYLQGIYRYYPKTKEFKKFAGTEIPERKLSNNDVRCFCEDKKGQMWIGTNGGGVNIFNPEMGSISYMSRDENNPENSISMNWVRSIVQDSYGIIWIGTTYGLNLYDPVSGKVLKYFHDKSDPTSISNDFVFTVYEDKDKNMWVGTSSGLNLFNRLENRFIKFYDSDGLPDNMVYRIGEDGHKNLWITTNNGLSKYNKKQNTFLNYDIHDGLVSTTFVEGSMLISGSTFYLGTVKGLIYFNPDSITFKNKKVNIEITDFKIADKSVQTGERFNGKIILRKCISKTDHIHISRKDFPISFDFTSFSYCKSNKIKYSGYLENHDKTWMPIEEGKNAITYNHLKNGRYTLYIKTTNLSKNTEKKLSITVGGFFARPGVKIGMFSLAVVFTILLWFLFFKPKDSKTQRNSLRITDFFGKYKEIKRRMEQLDSEMNVKNARLTSCNVLISHKNETMQTIKNKLLNLNVKSLSTEDSYYIKELIDQIDKEFKLEDDWEKFEEHFNQIHKEFFHKIRKQYPNLTLPYLKLISYIKMDLSSKEIAFLMNISIRGVEKARSRLKQKLELEKEENLTAFISEI